MIAEHIGESWWLLAHRGTEIVATWLVPIELTPDGPIARRSVRAMPYSSPRVTATHPKKRREIWRALIEFLQSECIGIELPLAPGLSDLGVFSQLGAFLEARQTHLVHPPGLTPAMLTGKARNAISAAATRTEIEISATVNDFDFDAAIVNAPDWQIRIRQTLAEVCARQRGVLMVSATRGGRSIGQVLALHDGKYALMMHAWMDHDSGVRGVPTLLIARLAHHAFSETRLQVLDLEGSILAKVDHFMDGVGAIPAPYAIAYWYRDRLRLFQQLEAALDIPGRQAEIET